MADLATTPQTAANSESPKRSAAREALLDLKARIGKSVLGQDHLVESMLIGLLANGNLLIESLPGLAKTRAVKTLAKHLAADLSAYEVDDALIGDAVMRQASMQRKNGRRYLPAHLTPRCTKLAARLQDALAWTARLCPIDRGERH